MEVEKIIEGLWKCWSPIKHSCLVRLKVYNLPGHSPSNTSFVYGSKEDPCRAVEMLESDKA